MQRGVGLRSELPGLEEIGRYFPINQRTKPILDDIINKYKAEGQVKKLDQPLDQDSKETLVALLATHKEPELLQKCLEAGLNPNSRDKFGRTPLMLACTYGCVECVRALLKAGANINDKNKSDNTALHIAAINDYPDIVEELTKSKADLLITNFNKHTAIKDAHEYGRVEAYKKLIDP